MGIRLLMGALFVLTTCFGFWLGGYDFDSRGDQAVLLLMASILMFGFGVTCPVIDWIEARSKK